ncbi:transporter [Bacteroidia bacterium]|nr:transporter [Bacteroidia bacterium]
MERIKLNRVWIGKRWLASLVTCLFLSQAGYSQLTITQCYELARNNYPLIKQYGLIDQTEAYNLSNATKGWLPQLSVNARATYQSEVTQMPFDVDKMAMVIPGFSIPVLSKDQYQVAAEVNQTLWDGGLIASSKALSRAQAKADRADVENELYTLYNRVNQLFFGCLLQDELLKQNALLQHELQVNIARLAAMMDNGVANLSDKESLEVELLNARQRAIELTASRKAYLSMLGALTGTTLDESTSLPAPAMPGSQLNFNISRPELNALNAKDNLLDTQNQLINAGLMPRVGLFVQGGYGRPGLNMLQDSFEPFYVAGIRLSWNLGKFYTLKDDRRKVETGRKAIGVQRETFLFNTSLQLMQQNTEVRKMNDLLQTDQEIVNLRTSIKQAAEVKLANGVISVTDLIREINAEDLAKQTTATHRVMQLMAVYNYMYAQGF